MPKTTEQKQEEDEHNLTCRHKDCPWEECEAEQTEYDLSSNEKLLKLIEWRKRRNVPFYGEPAVHFPAGTTYTNIADMIMDDEYWNSCITFTISHAKYIKDFTDLKSMLESGFGTNEESRNLLRGFKVILHEISMHKHNISQIHATDEYVGVEQLSSIMPRWKLFFLERNFRVTDIMTLPKKNSAGYTAYQNITGGIDRLREKSIALWRLGMILSLDEGKVLATSNRIIYKVRNIAKPIKTGLEILFLNDAGKYSVGFTWNYLIIQGKYSLTDTTENKTVNRVRQLTLDDPVVKDSRRIITMDNKFANIEFMQEARDNEVGIISSCIPTKTKHLSVYHQHSKGEVSKWKRGESEWWQNMNDEYGDIMLASWNDRNATFTLSNCVKVKNGYIDRRVRATKQRYSCPGNMLIYNYGYHNTDTQNQYLAQASNDHRTQRKQNRPLYQLMNAFGDINAYHIYINSKHLWQHKYSDHKQITMKLVLAEMHRNYKRRCITSNGYNHLILNRKMSSNKMLETTSETGHDNHELIYIKEDNHRYKRACIVCQNRTRYQCKGCKNKVRKFNMVTLCGLSSSRNCFTEFPPHQHFNLNIEDEKKDEDDDVIMR